MLNGEFEEKGKGKEQRAGEEWEGKSELAAGS